MPDLMFRISMPDELATELEIASRERDISPAQFAAQAVEVLLASRRLPHVAAAPHGARVIGHEPQPRTIGRVDSEPGGLAPAEVPTLDELDLLGDIA